MKTRAISSEAQKWERSTTIREEYSQAAGSGGHRKVDDMVCSIWRHIAARKSGDGLANRPEHKVKRACFKWSLGRELYTTPRIWVYAQNRDGSVNCNIRQGQNGKYQCYDSFSVERIDIRDHEILYVAVRNDTTGRTVFAWAKPEYEDSPSQANEPSREQLAELSGLVEQLAKERGVDNDKVIGGLMESKAMKAAGVTNGEIKTARQAATAIGQLKTWTRSGESYA